MALLVPPTLLLLLTPPLPLALLDMTGTVLLTGSGSGTDRVAAASGVSMGASHEITDDESSAGDATEEHGEGVDSTGTDSPWCSGGGSVVGGMIFIGTKCLPL